MALIILESAGAHAEIDSNGAYLKVLRVRKKDILFSVQQIGEKTRGGIPVCAPIFGPGEMVGLKQHGFARDVEWTVQETSDDEVTLYYDASTLAGIPSAYHGCRMFLTVKLRENFLHAQLTVQNESDKPFVCSPGFHPYFAVNDATQITVRSDAPRQFNTEELATTQFLPPHQERVIVELRDCLVTISSAELQQYAVWSANTDKYICVEPTRAGNLADQAEAPLLSPHSQQTFAMKLGWSIA